MRNLLMMLLTDPFGLASEPLKTLLQIVEDDDGEDVADEIENQITEIEIPVPPPTDGKSWIVKRSVILP